ncbi:MAG: DNA methyltransferase [Verrucomicrobia bacterium]|nr:DNA methyltransferase [Verrucomicrobiota bacterium]
MKTQELKTGKVSSVKLAEIKHLNRQIPPEPHTAMYVWHKYWSRKTWNVVAEFILHYTREQEIVFDPFAGSGVVAIEAVRHKRRAIVCDLNPAASRITELTLRPVKELALQQAFERVRERAQKRIEQLYQIHCVKCGAPLVAACFVREGDELTEVRYPKCPACEHRCETGGRPRKEDLEALAALEKRRIKEWHPKHRLYYADGTPFKEKQQYDSLDQLFTRRNLQAGAWLHEAISEESSPQLRKFLLGAFTSMIHLCTRMCPALAPGEGNHQTGFSSTWTQHSYWSAKEYMEQNVWEKFESAVIGHQGLLKAKEESNRLLDGVKITNDWREVLNGQADVAVLNADCLEVMEKMPEECVDYVFTDPPYDASIQYGELSFLWNAWLKEDFRYTEKLVTHEVVRNDRQRKSFDVYHSLLSDSFKGFYKVLRPGRYLTLTFHNPTFKVRNATVRAGVFAGFDYQKVHHQPLGQVSAKSMLQPFGSAQGDFYLRFAKSDGQQVRQMEEVTEERFRRIVLETCKQVIAERAEPTPYTILINFIDPVLARMGLFGTLDTGLDVKEVLEASVGREFRLVKTRLGGATGDLWWFNDPVFVARLQEVPLTERVEETVFRSLNKHGRVTFTQVWDEVSQEFPNSLTSDSTSIKEALEIYGRKVSKGYWILRDEIKARLDLHSEMIALLARIGKRRGHEIWVGRNEQGKRAGVVTVKPDQLSEVSNVRAVLDMDLLWLDEGKVVTAFEVECTTTMTSGLQRGSNLPRETPKVMVLPEERAGDFERKMQSPLFQQHFSEESWRLLYFDTFRRAFGKQQEKTDLESLFDKRNLSEGYQGQGAGQSKPSHQTLMDFNLGEGSTSSIIVDEHPS